MKKNINLRDRSIDMSRGLLVLAMVYGHVLQFFGDHTLFPEAGRIEYLINVIVFPSFMFFFGRTVSIAYLDKKYLRALPGMLRMTLRAYLAFCISGIAYLLFGENRHFTVKVIGSVMTLAKVPGWSEFLITFALVMLSVLILHPLLDRMRDYPWTALVVSAVCIGCTFIPYGSVTEPRLALWIGGADQSYFPVVQYLPYFLAGVVFTSLSSRGLLAAVGLAAAMSGGAGWSLYAGMQPNRFPPTWSWILLPAFAVVLLQAVTWGFCAIPFRPARFLARAIGGLGARSLYYLVASNLVLFTLSGMGKAPEVSLKAGWPWNRPIAAPIGALSWTLILFIGLAFMAALAGRGGSRKTLKQFIEEL